MNLRAAATVLTFAFATVACRDPHDLGERKLNARERALVHAVFGHTLDTGRITLHFRTMDDPDRPDGAGASVAPYNTRDISFYGHYAAYADFSQPQDAGLFLHESVHLWQAAHKYAQTGHIAQTGDYPGQRCYYYTPSPDSTFVMFGNEQQAAMVADYFNAFISAQPSSPVHLLGRDSSAHELLKTTVEAQFPGLRTLRMTR